MAGNGTTGKIKDLFEDLRSKLESYGETPNLETRTISVCADIRVWEFLNFISNVDQLRVQRGNDKSLKQEELMGVVLSEGVRSFFDTQTLDLLLAQLAETPISGLVAMFYKTQAIKKFYPDLL